MDKGFATISDVWEAYNQHHVRGARTAVGIRNIVKNYFSPIMHLPTTSLTVMGIRGWLMDIRTGATGRKKSEAVANRCLTILRAMINYAIECGMWTAANPAARCKRTPGVKRTTYVTDEEMPKLLKVLDTFPVAPRLYFSLVLFSGCRPGEAEAVKIADIQNGIWTKIHTKSKQPQQLMLPDDMLKMIEKHLAGIYAGQVYLFENHKTKKPLTKTHWSRVWGEVRKEAGIPNIKPHDLRRTCATRLNNGIGAEGLDIISISKGVLNHSNISTTQVYAIPSMERVKKALEANMRRAMQKPVIQPPTQEAL